MKKDKKCDWMKLVTLWNIDEDDHYAKVIVAASGTVEDYVPFYAPENAVLSDNHHLEVSPKQHNDVKTCSFAKYAKEHKQKLNMPTNLLGDKYIKNLHILAFLVVLPLLRSHDFQEGHYASNRRKLLWHAPNLWRMAGIEIQQLYPSRRCPPNGWSPFSGHGSLRPRKILTPDCR